MRNISDGCPIADVLLDLAREEVDGLLDEEGETLDAGVFAGPGTSGVFSCSFSCTSSSLEAGVLNGARIP